MTSRFSCREVVLPVAHVFISPIEIQMADKIYPGSPKDIENALFLHEIFKEHLDKSQLKEQMKAFHVRGDNYGIVL